MNKRNNYNIVDRYKKDLTSMIPIGEKVEVEVKRGSFKGIYASRVEDVLKEIKIALPTDEKGRYAILENNTPILISYFLKKKLLAFNSRTIQRSRENNLKILLISFPDEILRIEKREFFRVIVNIVSHFIYKRAERKGLLIDISGSGVSIQTDPDIKLKIGDILELKIKNLKFSVSIKIVRTISSPASKKPRYGAYFVNVSVKQRDKIIRYCFSESIKQRKLLKLII